MKARGIRGVDEFANRKRRCPDRVSAGQGICLVGVAGFAHGLFVPNAFTAHQPVSPVVV
jgi:hypothetical protein